MWGPKYPSMEAECLRLNLGRWPELHASAEAEIPGQYKVQLCDAYVRWQRGPVTSERHW